MVTNHPVFETAFNTYTAVALIGQGGSGRVYDVKDARGAPFAVKVLDPLMATSTKRLRFEREILFSSGHEHKNLIRVIGSGVTKIDGKSAPFYVMPKYPATLRKLIVERQIKPEQVLPIYGQILDGVEAAHKLGVTHRDLKPENILFDVETGLVVVADWGIAGFEEEVLAETFQTMKGERLANFLYSAPEQREPGQVVSYGADIWALGLILNEMFTGEIAQGEGHASIGARSPEFAYLDALVNAMRQHRADARPSSIDAIKGELIARGSQFIERQRLDELRKRVVPVYQPDQINEITIKKASYENGALTLVLSEPPRRDWIQRFQSGTGIGGYMSRLAPHMYNFQGDGRVVVGTDGTYAQVAIDQFKQWAPGVTSYIQDQLTQAALRAEEQNREQLRAQIERADSDSKINAVLKL